MKNLVHFEQNGLNDIVTNQFERGMSKQMLYIFFTAGEKIIQANNIVAALNKSIAKVGADKTGAAGYKCAHIENPYRKAGLEIFSPGVSLLTCIYNLMPRRAWLKSAIKSW